MSKLTPEQIENWRNILATSFGFGAYARLMPDERVQELRDEFQRQADTMATCPDCNSDEKRAKWQMLRQECPTCHGTMEVEDGDLPRQTETS